MPHFVLEVLVILDHYQSADIKMSRYYQQLLFLTKCLIAFKFTQNFPSFINGTHFFFEFMAVLLYLVDVMLSQIDKLATSHITTNFEIYLIFSGIVAPSIRLCYPISRLYEKMEKKNSK